MFNRPDRISCAMIRSTDGVFGLILALCCSLTLAACQEANESPERPNILWIVSEDNSPWLGSYGDPVATTPHLDALAAEGIRYTRAYSNAPVCAPSRHALITGAYPIAFGTEHMRSSYKIPEEIRFYPSYLRAAGYYTTNNYRKDYNTIDQPTAWDESSKSATYRNRADGQPFFHITNLTTTHESSLHRGSVAENHDPADVSLAPYHPDTPEVRNDYAVYYDRLQEMDGQVGEILDQLEVEGLADSTIVFYYSDHGGGVAGRKRFLTEGGLHVPLLTRVPEQFRHLVGYETMGTVDRPVSFIDLPPTLLRIAGVVPPPHMAGSSVLHESGNRYVFAYGGRMDERRNLVRSVTDGEFRLTRNFLPHRPYGRRLEFLWRAPLMRSWAAEYEAGRLNAVQSAFFEPRAAVELYHVRQDPHQTTNLAKNPRYSDKLKELSDALTTWQVKQRDAGLIPEPMLVELDREGVIRDYVVSDDYPIDAIVLLAQEAGTADPAMLEYFLQQLRSGAPRQELLGCQRALAAGAGSGAGIVGLLKTRSTSLRPWTGVVLAEVLIRLGHLAPATRLSRAHSEQRESNGSTAGAGNYP